MGNTLCRGIEPNERVVVHSHLFRGLKLCIKDRTFICESGDGMLADSDGRVITGRWLSGKEGVIYGYWISKERPDEV